MVNRKSDWAEILQIHTYGHSSGIGVKIVLVPLFLLSYLSKVAQKKKKKHSVSHNRVKTSPTGLKFF